MKNCLKSPNTIVLSSAYADNTTRKGNAYEPVNTPFAATAKVFGTICE